MRASLASATSLLALLLVQGHDAYSATITSFAPTVSFGNVLVSPGVSAAGTETVTISNGTGTSAVFGAAASPVGPTSTQSPAVSSGTATATYTFSPPATGAFSSTATVADGTQATFTLIGTGVAPVAVGPASSVTFGGYALVGSTISGVALNVSLNNLNGSISSSGNSVFVGTPQSFSLTDNSKGVVSTSSSSFGFTFAPTTAGATGPQTRNSTVTTTFSNGAAGTNAAAAPVTTTLTATAVAPVQPVNPAAAPVHASAGTSASTEITISHLGHGNLSGLGSASSTISFSTLHHASSRTVNPQSQNTTADLNGGDASLTNLTIEKFSISGGDAAAFSVSSFVPGSVITEGSTLLLPLAITVSSYGALSSSLTIFTDESVGLAGLTGDTFTYALAALNVPEPGSLAVLGAGLAGLAGFRRGRAQSHG